MVLNFGYREKAKIILKNSWDSVKKFFILKIIFGYTDALAYITWRYVHDLKTLFNYFIGKFFF